MLGPEAWVLGPEAWVLGPEVWVLGAEAHLVRESRLVEAIRRVDDLELCGAHRLVVRISTLRIACGHTRLTRTT